MLDSIFKLYPKPFFVIDINKNIIYRNKLFSSTFKLSSINTFLSEESLEKIINLKQSIQFECEIFGQSIEIVSWKIDVNDVVYYANSVLIKIPNYSIEKAIYNDFNSSKDPKLILSKQFKAKTKSIFILV